MIIIGINIILSCYNGDGHKLEGGLGTMQVTIKVESFYLFSIKFNSRFYNLNESKIKNESADMYDLYLYLHHKSICIICYTTRSQTVVNVTGAVLLSLDKHHHQAFHHCPVTSFPSAK